MSAPAASAPPSGTIPCPSCHAPVAATSRFCPACGATIVAPPPTSVPVPASGGTAPVDIRSTVDADRGFLKRLQLLIPGFRGYRQGEDLRAADSLLRLQTADRVHQSIAILQDTRTQLTQRNQFQGLTDLAPPIADLQKLEGEIRHAEQGYTGISPAVRIRPEQQDSLYQYDYGFVSAADQVAQTANAIRAAAVSGGGDGVGSGIATLRTQVAQLDAAFKARIEAIEGIQV